ncbi:LEAF RUST 10 DISEASE-RESISTANCE LOCUS RECEPTOR-LIKE PROTEIN KINASE-like 2.7 [Silene latifolia]|uniref:LEAF RUST 10 DISEASE-RESISTANCE LOCUS RECEPTOR-LIKE PROTEIN KINASE-like 2.7 n=1 Tax=Silene latifolia TaxID=37657 RepID=UPI003D780555
MFSESYYILSMDATSDAIYVAMQSFWDDLCPQTLFNTNTTINLSLYKNTSIDDYITLVYNCPTTSSETENEIDCRTHATYNKSYSPTGYIITQNMDSSQVTSLYKSCPDRILVTVAIARIFHKTISDITSLHNALKTGFTLEWIAENELCHGCRQSGGECGSDSNLATFTCFCADRPYDSKCSTGDKGSTHHKVIRTIAGLILGLLGLGIITVLVTYYCKKRYSTENQDNDASLKKCGSLTPKVYAYKSLKKITSSFKEKLGEGGFGIVYKGKLQDGHLVAVKVLRNSTGNADDFINEVRSIGRTNHVNIVMLLGFSVEGQKRALIYDYMPKGSLDKFINGNNNYQSLGWEKLLEIAVGIARGLEYLHRGCNTRIVHFDIKPHNILLDENFCPKIADFGLAKLCKQNVSIVPLSRPRGTVGFIAPEVYRQSSGGGSHKSDVYSYGMLVLEMVGCRKNVHAQIRHSTQYFPYWIYDHLEQTEEIAHQDILNGDENGTLNKMMLVGLWSIQENPSDRPPMTRVVEMLVGPLESLQIPPRPSLSQHNSTDEATEKISSFPTHQMSQHNSTEPLILL